MLNIAEVSPVVREKDGEQIVDNQGRPTCYFTVGVKQPFGQIRLRNMWGRISESEGGEERIVWERLSPEEAVAFMKSKQDLTEFGVKLVAKDTEPFTPEGFDQPITTVRLLVFPDETEKQALGRLYDKGARFKGEPLEVTQDADGVPEGAM